MDIRRGGDSLKKSKKEILIETSLRLFNEHGYHATGIDTVMRESGVSKTTLYKYFRTKEELILAVLKFRHEQLDLLFQTAIEKVNEETSKIDGVLCVEQQKIIAVFNALDQWFQSENFFGCNFINASAEYGDKEDPIHQYAAYHKAWVCDYLCAIMSGLSKELSDELVLVMDGAIVTAHVRGDRQAAQKAKRIAQLLLSANMSQ